MDERSTQLMAEAVERRLSEGQTDYWLDPLVLSQEGHPIGRIAAGDAVVFCCRRGEREIQLTRAFVDEEFGGFPRARLSPLSFVPLTLYHPDLRHLKTAFAPQDIPNTLGEVISRAGLPQLRVGEAEKYAHVTYFLSGGRWEPYPGEVDRRVPSDLSDPVRALPALIDALVDGLDTVRPAFAAVNIATGDILGHTTTLGLKVMCAEAVDRALGQVVHAAAARGFWTAITADHGLLEDCGPRGGPPNSSHTTNPVPFLLLGPAGQRPEVCPSGRLADVAPTLLAMLGLDRPEEMTGEVLLTSPIPCADRVLLIVLDGWGLASVDRVDPVALARTPLWDELAAGPMARLDASGEAVGLLPGRKGNSEAGHLNLGAGRVVLQDDVRIEQAIRARTFAEVPAFRDAIAAARARGGDLHLLGLLSEASSHGSIDYVVELLRLAAQERMQTFVHVITDGRSTEPGTAPQLLRRLGQKIVEIGVGRLATAMGRGIALDRGGDYQTKTRRAYNALTLGEGTLVEAAKGSFVATANV